MKGFVGTIGAGIVTIALLYVLLNNYKAIGSVAAGSVGQLGRLENTFQASTNTKGTGS